MTIGLSLWTVYFIAVFLLPGTWLHDRTFDIMDRMYWWMVPAWGKVWPTAAIACTYASLTMVGQYLLTNNRRLSEAKRRAALLRKKAMLLPDGSPRRTAMLALANPVQNQITMAAFVPLAVILGPLMMTFLWIPARLDPASWNAPAGTQVNVTATVDGNYLEPVELSVGAPLTIDEQTPAKASVPDYLKALNGQYARWLADDGTARIPQWEARATALKTREQMLGSLKAYIDAGKVPPQELAWQVRATSLDDKGNKLPAAGRFPIVVTTDGQSHTLYAVLGDQYAPMPVELRPAGGAVHALKIAYAKPPKQETYWAPFAKVPTAPVIGKWASWDAGWLWVYLLAYLPPMLLLRWLLRIP
jgi:hypothetical protein